ncbi:MAG: hypothetical protein JNL98_30790 [Bryobacterales bacterium]|nr:hypothetical protein [Bryobacterales bacterium]
MSALAHRDYRDRQSTKIYVFADRIEFESPGGLVSLPGLDAAKQRRTHWRNPSLARYPASLGLAQERGTVCRSPLRRLCTSAEGSLSSRWTHVSR